MTRIRLVVPYTRGIHYIDCENRTSADLGAEKLGSFFATNLDNFLVRSRLPKTGLEPTVHGACVLDCTVLMREVVKIPRESE